MRPSATVRLIVAGIDPAVGSVDDAYDTAIAESQIGIYKDRTPADPASSTTTALKLSPDSPRLRMRCLNAGPLGSYGVRHRDVAPLQ